MPGPAPNPNRRRRNVGPQLLELPSEGRPGRAPRWPLDEQSKSEKAVWADLWKLPQAVMWERFSWTRTVARYVRVLVRAEEPGAGRDVMTETRLLEVQLGLTPRAMKDLMWKVADDELAEARKDHPSSSATRRLRAVDPGAVAGT